VGESGAGKSTLIALLLRAFDPDAGQVLIDDHDLRLLDPRHWRQAIGYVEQDVTLFDNTIGYNLSFGLNGRASQATSTELDQAMQMARLGDLLASWPHGYETMIGEKGIKLSGGQKQRLGIARSMIKKPSILIFDEATSNLDATNERLIHQAIDEVSHGKTTLIIAHRLSTIKNVDKIVVLKQGKILATGSYSELVISCPDFNRFIAAQAGEALF
jgi:ATP-binding cassette subfamily B protein